MIFAVIIPAILVIAANKKVFPDASWLATGMVITTMGIAIIFAVASAFATPKVKRYVLIAAFAIDTVLAGNLAFHWVLAREISGAKQVTTVRHEEEDREEARREAEAKRHRELIAEQTALAAETAKQLRMEAIRNDSARRLGIRAPRGATVSAPSAPVTVSAPAAEVTASAKPAAAVVAPRTVEEVMNEYTPWLLGFAIAELLTSVVAFGICALLWEWDLDGDGVADHLQRRREIAGGPIEGFARASHEEHSCPATEAVRRQRLEEIDTRP
jgi:hypothetical protein